MATSRKTRRKPTQPASEGLAGTLSETAQQIWLAGLGALGRAQAEGTRLFETLVKEGLDFENTARRATDRQAGAVREVVEASISHARERATEAWDQVEKLFEERVRRALATLGAPGRDDILELSRRIDALAAELRGRPGGSSAGTRSGRAGTAKTKAANRSPAKKAGKARSRAARD